MTPEAGSDFAAVCAALRPGFVAVGAPRKARKSELLWGELDGAPVIAKRLVAPSDVWAWYQAREAAVYRAFVERAPGVRVPRLVAEGGGVLIVERMAGEPLATKRRPRAALPIRTIGALMAMRDELATWAGRAVEVAPSPRVRAQLRERLLEDPTAVEWIRDGLARCAKRGFLDERAAKPAIDALIAHAPVGFSHGDLLLRNVVADDDEDLALVDWECAGTYVRDWDLALLWTQLAPAARSFVEDAVRDSGRRWRAFLALVAFALARELRFLAAFNAPAGDPAVVLAREELAETIARLAT